MLSKKPTALIATIAVLSALGAVSVSSADIYGNSVGVAVNGNTISFPGTQPVEMRGSVLVPLRGVFEALGARVDFNPATSTIRAWRDGRTIVLPLGSSTATVNGQPQSLSQPAQAVNGTTLVPLRFVAEALGDYVDWNSATRMVEIQRQGQPANVAQAPTPGRNERYQHRRMDTNEANMVVGTIRRVTNVNGDQVLEIDANGTRQSVTIARRASIYRGDDRRSATSAAIADLQRGDMVWIRLGDTGLADSITAVPDNRR
ncbi:MAG TPA: copper amine oxidase N-terminal domain-containing protein [Capsulimonadaceae bacterium]|jgi:hypothetical protein